MSAEWRILQGDALERLRELPDRHAQTCVTSPPYWGLRDYGIDGQLGLEATPADFVADMVEIFDEVGRVLRPDGTLWLNLGDCYDAGTRVDRVPRPQTGLDHGYWDDERINRRVTSAVTKPKDLLGLPWEVALALRSAGWWLRCDIVWAKPNPMPESVTDRPTRAHEFVFLMTRAERYYYDAAAIREPFVDERNGNPGTYQNTAEPDRSGFNTDRGDLGFVGNGGGWERGAELGGRNKRTVWDIPSQAYPEAHFATFPERLVEPCVLAGSAPKCCAECAAPWRRVIERKGYGSWSPGRDAMREGASGADGLTGSEFYADYEAPATVGWEPSCAHSDDSGRCVVLDPFAGSGTTGVVALRHDRSFVGVELNPAYVAMARRRITDDAPLLNSVAEAS